MRKAIIWILMLIVLALIVYRVAIRDQSPEILQEAEKPKAIPVKVVTAQKGDINEILSFVGDVKAQDQINIYPKVSGKLIEIRFREGQQVKKGDIIALIDRDVTGLKFETAAVTSPIDGIVGRVYLDIGSVVSPPNPAPSMGTPIIMVVSMDQVKVRVNVIERNLPRVKKEQKAEIKVDAFPDRVFSGKVSTVSPVVDELSRTAPVEIVIDNQKHLLKPGFFARVDLLVGEHRGVTIIPEECLLKVGEQRYVYVAKDGLAGRRNISVGLAENEHVQVLDGLDVGEMVVYVGQQMLINGVAIEVKGSPEGGESR